MQPLRLRLGRTGARDLRKQHRGTVWLAGILMAGFQVTLICTGNLSFLNWLTIIPCIACIEVKGLMENDAKVEIETTAVLP